MIELKLELAQANALKDMLAKLMANQTETNLNNVVLINRNCIFFLELIEKQLTENKAL